MSGLEIVSALASAAQLADLGFRLLKSFSRLYRDVKEVPNDVKSKLTQINQLVEIASLVSASPALHTPVITATIEEALCDIEQLLKIVEKVLQSRRSHFFKQQWETISHVAREPTIHKILERLESSKATLSICIDTINNQALGTIGVEVKHIRHASDQVVEWIPAIHDTVRKTLTVVEDVPKMELHLQSLTANQETLLEKMIDIRGTMPDFKKLDGMMETVGSLATNVAHAMRSRQIYAIDKTTESKQKLFLSVAQNPLFTGRKSIARMISDSFASTPGHQQRTVLVGLGGVGKTQIATAFVYSPLATTRFSKVFWTFAGSRPQLIKSFTDIAKALGICSSATVSRTSLSLESMSEPSVPSSREVNALLAWMSQEGNTDWLLVFDNLDDLESFDISEFFPKVPFGHILITSRRQNAARLGKAIPVDTMSDEDGLELLYKCSSIPEGHELTKAKELVALLGNLPLAIDQAGAYMACGCLDFDDYLTQFKDRQAELLSEKPSAAIWTYEHTVYTTWEISVTRLRESNRLAVQILDLAANFDSHDIPIDLVLGRAQPINLKDQCFLANFFHFASPTGNYDMILGPMPDELAASQTEIATAIGMLVSFSLVRRKKASKNLVIHPLVHTWLSDRVPSAEKRLCNARNAICLINRAMFNACNLSQFADVQALYSHVFKCNMLVEKYGGLSALIDIPRLGGCIIAIDAWVPLSVDQATLEKSDKFYQLITDDFTKDLWQIPEAMWQIRSAYRLSSQGYRKQSSAICEAYFKSSCPKDRFEEMYQACMAQMYCPSLFRQMKHARAEEIYARSPTHCDKSGYMLARKNLVLGAIKIDLNQLDESERFLESCAEVLRHRVGPEFFIWSVWHLLMALCRLAQGRPKDAEKIVSPLLHTRLGMLETRKGHFSFSDYELVEVYARSVRCQGRYEEAICFIEDVLLKTRSTHPPPARALGELSLTLALLERLCAKAEIPLACFDKSIAVIDFTAVLQDARLAFDRASDAYSLEWTRGTWVFKHCPVVLKELASRFYCSVGTDTHVSIIENSLQPGEQDNNDSIAQEVPVKDVALGETVQGQSLPPSPPSVSSSQPTKSDRFEEKQQHEPGAKRAEDSRKESPGDCLHRPSQIILIDEVESINTTLPSMTGEVQILKSKRRLMVNLIGFKRPSGMRKAIRQLLPMRTHRSAILVE